MKPLILPLSRIILRYGVGALVAAGYLTLEHADLIGNDIEIVSLIAMAIGGVLSGITEFGYWIARKRGGAT